MRLQSLPGQRNPYDLRIGNNTQKNEFFTFNIDYLFVIKRVTDCKAVLVCPAKPKAKKSGRVSYRIFVEKSDVPKVIAENQIRQLFLYKIQSC